MNLDDCLPAQLRGPTTTITRVAAGLSGAGVYRVEAAGQTYILKVATPGEPLAAWQQRVAIQRAAAGAGLAPAIVHVDEERRAVVSAFVVDRSFPMLLMTPATRDAALALLGTTLRRVHALPVPPGAEPKDPRGMFGQLWPTLAGFRVPMFVREIVERVLAEPPPPRDRELALCHNDVNPTNLTYDGEHLMLLDWDTAGPNDPLYDLAAISVFLRMDDDACKKLLAAHDDAPVATMPPRLAYSRRLVAAFSGTMFLHIARLRGHAGATGDETLDATLPLGDVYQRMRAGALDVGSAAGQWAFGLALVKASASL